MKNPLIKRLPREFTGEIAKYIVIFIFMTAVIGLISGFLIADGSVLDTYNKSFDKYNVEDGNFELYSKADDKLIDRLEEENVTIYENFYKEETLKVHNNEKLREDDQSTIRFYINRDDIDAVIAELIAIMYTIMDLIRYYNVLATRKLPQFDNYSGGDDNA